LGFEFNIYKTEIFWPLYDGNKHCEGLFLSHIRRSTFGVKLFGGVISRDMDFIEELAIKRAFRVV